MSTFFDYPGGEGDRRGDDNVCFAGLSPVDWERLVAATERRRFAAGDVVMGLGEAERSLYLIATGTVEVFVGDADAGTERSVRVQGPGSVLGEVAFFDGRPRSASVRALSSGEVLRLSEVAFDGLAGRHPDLARKILVDLGRILALRLRQAEARDAT